jgi:hypothetical protein
VSDTDQTQVESSRSQPQVETLAAQPYVAVRGEVTPDTFRSFVDSNFGRPIQWLASKNLAMTGAPFIRYLSVDGDGEPAEIEIAAPVAEPVVPDDGLIAGELPAGRYVTYLHVGPYQHDELDDLRDAERIVPEWAEGQGIELAATEQPGGGLALGASAEHYLVDPVSESDYRKWQTRIVMLIAG